LAWVFGWWAFYWLFLLHTLRLDELLV
jgi:hypothetical protein